MQRTFYMVVEHFKNKDAVPRIAAFWSAAGWRPAAEKIATPGYCLPIFHRPGIIIVGHTLRFYR